MFEQIDDCNQMYLIRTGENPNSSEPIEAFICDGCGCPVYVGDYYARVGADRYCKDCYEIEEAEEDYA